MLGRQGLHRLGALWGCRRSVTSEALVYSARGDPEKVLCLLSKKLEPFSNDEVLVKVLAAPINPADINMIEGSYPIKQKLPAVAGNEGAGRVIACGKNVSALSVGDIVIPGKAASGTWQTYLCGPAENFIKISHPISSLDAAVVSVNPATALHLVNNFVKLQKGDTLIQNGSTSAAGIYVIQIAKILGLNTVNLFRDRTTAEATEQTRDVLKNYGATWAVSETEFLNQSYPIEVKNLGPFKLALNCLGGKPAINLLKSLDYGGTMVSYGAMTRNPMPIPVGPFIFKDLRLRGFWLTSFISQIPFHDRCLIIDQLSKWFSDGLLIPSPFMKVPFTEWAKGLSLSAFRDSVPTGVRQKVILTME